MFVGAPRFLCQFLGWGFNIGTILVTMQYMRKNLIMSGWICVILGTGIVFSDLDSMLSIIGTTMSLAGLMLIILGIGSKEQGMTSTQIAEWNPSQDDLKDTQGSDFENKRIKFRIDTTIDEPIKTSILCGNCSELTIIQSTKPQYFKCPKCKLELWEEE